MKKTIIYKARNGARFDTKAMCRKYELLRDAIDAAFEGCPSLPADPHCNFANGGGYLQWTHTQRTRCERALRKLMVKLVPNNINAKTTHMGMLCRVADDNGSPLYDALLRLDRQDSALREWGQGYYAINPFTGKQQEYKEEPEKEG